MLTKEEAYIKLTRTFLGFSVFCWLNTFDNDHLFDGDTLANDYIGYLSSR